jgi:hypothetical protein
MTIYCGMTVKRIGILVASVRYMKVDRATVIDVFCELLM